MFRKELITFFNQFAFTSGKMIYDIFLGFFTPKTCIIRPIFNNKDEMIQLVNFKPRLLKIETPIIFLIYEPIMLSISWVKNDICWNCITCIISIPKEFWFLSNHTHNHWNTYSSFFNVGMMASSTKTICLKKQSFSSVVGFIVAFTKFKCK